MAGHRIFWLKAGTKRANGMAMRTLAILLIAAASLGAKDAEPRPEMRAAMELIAAEYGALAAAPERFAEVDLDGDGSPEIIAYVRSPQTCGSGGCTLMVFDMEDTGLVPIGRIPASRLPVSVYPEKHGGFRDLGITTAGGGFAADIRRVPFAGRSYAPSAWDGATSTERRHGTVVLFNR